jgi:N-acetylmuramoyl-L-alanine amidase
MNRLLVRGSSLFLALTLAAGVLAPARAQTARTNFWFAGTQLIFDHATPLDGDIAVTLRDSGLARFLAKVGATIAFIPQQRYVIVTGSDRRTVVFTLGDARYTAAGVTATGAFAPFINGNDVELPFLTLAQALYVENIDIAGETVLEPQMGALDVRSEGRRTIVTLHGATQLRATTLAETPDRVQLAFTGIGSTLPLTRRIGTGVDEVDIVATGNVRNPTTTVTIAGAPGTLHRIVQAASPYDFTVVFGPPGVALDTTASPATSPQSQPVRAFVPPVAPPVIARSTPAPALTSPPALTTAPPIVAEEPSPQASSAPAVISAITLEPAGDALEVRLAIDGTATYAWHRLPDQRWYVDITNATLGFPEGDQRPNSPLVDSLRVRQIGTPDAPVVRLALTLRGDRRVSAGATDGQLAIAVTSDPETDVAHSGDGTIGSIGAPAMTPAPIAEASEPSPLPSAPWRFAPAGGRTIVLDPGHGGDDDGTAHNGLMEKTLTLDIARRLRTLLAQSGWTVLMTRDADIDPVSPALLASMRTDGLPNPSDRAYLQTRCDVANNANARIFVSIHVNYSPSAAISGTTFYYTKPQDVALAQALEAAVIPAAATHDDGVVHANFYVTKHTTMPAVLIETAFISNPGDVAKLTDPAWLQTLARGIANGVAAYAHTPPTSAFEQ